MKEIKAVVQPFRLAKIREACRKVPGFPGMTVYKVEGSGYHPGQPAAAGIKGELTDYSAKVRLEIVSPDEQVESLLSILHEVCHTGQPGDGVAWVTPVEYFLRLRKPRQA
ncbi:MAG: P-II family nitrogen regulator [Burkholderiaceae bacterium]